MAKPGQRQVPKYPPQRTSNQPLRRSNSDTRSSYTRPNQPLEEPGLPTDRSEIRSPSDPYPREAALPKVDRDFYETYPAPPYADVQEDWDEDEATMSYGDWETEVSSSPQRYPQTDPGTPYTTRQDSNWQGARSMPQHQAKPRSAHSIHLSRRRAYRKPDRP